jgi:hypothetical protein
VGLRWMGLCVFPVERKGAQHEVGVCPDWEKGKGGG